MYISHDSSLKIKYELGTIGNNRTFFSNRQKVAKPSILVICEFFNDAVKRLSLWSVRLKRAVYRAGNPCKDEVVFCKCAKCFTLFL